MTHQDMKQLLQQAGTPDERTEAINTALSVGMSLREIEEYLDYLDTMGYTVDQEWQEHREPVPSPPIGITVVQPAPHKLSRIGGWRLLIYTTLVVCFIIALGLGAISIYRAWKRW